ncbi:Ig-like domain-containing protein [Agromyces agglutinans]|nr:Ig-like domain-containing protein [Agromyces agglutinans]
MSRTRVAAVVALTALMAAAAPVAAHADDADTTKPVVGDAVFAPVKGVATFALSQVEASPKKAYVEIQQKDDAGKWKKQAGQWFFDTNDFSFVVDTDALADGPATQLKVSTWDQAGNQSGKTFPVVIDRTKPVATLVAPISGGPVSDATLDLQVDATDDEGLNRITANLYQAGKLVKSTSSSAGSALAGSHVASVALPDGEYSIKFNASDLAGNIAQTGTFAIEIDTTAPTVTLKDAVPAKGVFATAPSFKLSDAGVGQVDHVLINGVERDLTDDKWSDLNTGAYTPKQGVNTIIAVDTAGNQSAPVEFAFDSVAPKAVVKSGVTPVDGVYNQTPSFKLSDSGVGKVDFVEVNGVVRDLSDSTWSDLNAGAYTPKQGVNTIVVVDTAGNRSTTTFTFAVVAEAPAAQ